MDGDPMAQVEREIEGPLYGNCNCDWGCPCQFNKLPTRGSCKAVGSRIIEKGRCGGVDYYNHQGQLAASLSSDCKQTNLTEVYLRECGHTYRNPAHRDYLIELVKGWMLTHFSNGMNTKGDSDHPVVKYS